MRPRSLSKSVLKNEAKTHQKMHNFSTLFGAIWAPKIIKIEPGASKRPPEEQQAHKKRPRGTKSIKKNAENCKKTPKKHLALTFLSFFRCQRPNKKVTKKRKKTNRKKNRESSPCLIGSGQRVLCYMLLCYYVITRAQQPAPKKSGAGGRGRSP